MVMLSIRNLCRCILTLAILVISRMLDSPELLKSSGILATNTSLTDLDLSQSSSLPLLCMVVSTADHFLMILLMFYLASLSLYLVCRKANPSTTVTSDATLRLYGLNSGIVPVRERKWVSPLLILLPLLLSVLMCLPIPLLKKTHPVTVVPNCTLCKVPDARLFDIYQSSVIILGFYLPSAIIVFLILCLSFRRCFNCSADKCVSSFCKEELTTSLLSIPYLILYQVMYLPHLNHLLYRLDIPQLAGVENLLSPELLRGVEVGLGLLLPTIIYAFMPAYGKFKAAPDDSDVKNEVHRASRTPSRRISLESEFTHV